MAFDFLVDGALTIYLFLGSIGIGYIFLRTGFVKTNSISKESRLGWSIIFGASFSLMVTIFSIGGSFLNIAGFGYKELFFVFSSLIFVVAIAILSLKSFVTSRQLQKQGMFAAQSQNKPVTMEKKFEAPTRPLDEQIPVKKQVALSFDNPRELNENEFDEGVQEELEKKVEKLSLRQKIVEKKDLDWPENEVTQNKMQESMPQKEKPSEANWSLPPMIVKEEKPKMQSEPKGVSRSFGAQEKSFSLDDLKKKLDDNAKQNKQIFSGVNQKKDDSKPQGFTEQEKTGSNMDKALFWRKELEEKLRQSEQQESPLERMIREKREKIKSTQKKDDNQ